VDTTPVAWLVVPARGQPAAFVDHGKATDYAARCHGIVVPLGPLAEMPPINPGPVGR
jgi:hypothetical protein